MKNALNLLAAAAIMIAAQGVLRAGEFENAVKDLERSAAGYKSVPPVLLPVAAPAPAEGGGQFKMSADEEGKLFAMTKAELAAATPDQKVEMVRTLIRHSVPTEAAYNGLSAQEYRERTIARILSSAPDAASFDRIYYRVDPVKLRHSLTAMGRDRILALAKAAGSSVAPGDWSGLDRYIETVTDARPPSRDLVKFLIDGPSVMSEGGKALIAAKSSIHIEIFQLQADEIGQGLAKLLSEKAKAGVKVRVLIDEYGSKLSDDPALAEMIASMRAGGIAVLTQKPSFLKDHLDHRKVVVIDGNVGFTGGMNIGRLYQVDWHDQQTLLIGPAVSELQRAFTASWYVADGELISSMELFPVTQDVPAGAETRVVVHAGHQDQNIKAVYIRAIGTAQKSIKIANPYFTDEDVVLALCKAAWRGVKVELVLPQENDQAIVRRASRANYPKLVKAGVLVYEYKGRMAHEKVAVMDGRWSTLGSSNLDARSFDNNDELNLVVTDPGVAADIETRLFGADLLNSELMNNYSPGVLDQMAHQVSGML